MLAAVRNFVVVFIVAALIFGTIAYFITGFIAENIIGIADSPDESTDTADASLPGSPDSAPPPETEGEIYIPEDEPKVDYPDLDGESFNILLIGTDYRPDDFDDYIEDLGKTKKEKTLGMLSRPIRTRNADLMMLVCVNEETRRITFTCIPANTRVSVNNSYVLLNSCYDKYGSETIVDFVNYLTATPIDYFITANVTDAGKIINLIDGVDVNVPSDVYNPYYNLFKSSNAALSAGMTGEYDFATKIAIEAGTAHIDSSNIFPLLHYRTKSASAGEHEAVLVELARAALKKAVSAEYIVNAAELFTRAVSYAETNMTVTDLTNNLGIFRAYDEFEISTLTYPGTISTLGDADCFIPDTTAAYQMFRAANNITSAAE